MSAGIRSRRVERTWPNLTNMGPRDSRARRRRTPRGRLGRLPSRTMRSRGKARGCLIPERTRSSRRSGRATRIICSSRKRLNIRRLRRPLVEVIQPRLQRLEALFEAGEVFGMQGKRGLVGHERAFVSKIFGGVACQPPAAAPGGPGQGRQRAQYPARRDVANVPSQFVLDIPPQVACQLGHRLGQGGVALYVQDFGEVIDTAFAQQSGKVLPSTGSHAQCDIGNNGRITGLGGTACIDGETNKLLASLEMHGFSAVPAESLPCPVFAVQQSVEQTRKQGS